LSQSSTVESNGPAPSHQQLELDSSGENTLLQRVCTAQIMLLVANVGTRGGFRERAERGAIVPLQAVLVSFLHLHGTAAYALPRVLMLFKSRRCSRRARSEKQGLTTSVQPQQSRFRPGGWAYNCPNLVPGFPMLDGTCRANRDDPVNAPLAISITTRCTVSGSLARAAATFRSFNACIKFLFKCHHLGFPLSSRSFICRVCTPSFIHCRSLLPG
jgi:hypothetical protein